jgi:hypothetical protein
MKTFGIIPILLFFLLLIAYQCTNAQNYVVNIKGDTVKGDLKPYTYGPDKKVVVTGADRKKLSYPILQLRSYTYDGNTYRPVKKDDKYVFMKVIQPGYLTLYGFQMENQMGFDGLFLQKRDGSGMEVPNLSFKKPMRKFLEDCAPVAGKIENGEYSRKDLTAIITDYNSCLEDKTANNAKTFEQQNKPIVQTTEWNSLEEKLKAKDDFAGKANALEMVAEIKAKIARSEKVPNFLIQGLKESLSETDLKDDLDQALQQLPQ